MALLESKLDSKRKKNQTVDFADYNLSSKIKELLTVETMESIFNLPGLGIALRTYFYDINNEEAVPGNEKKKRVSVAKLPPLSNRTVSYISFN
jgi:hypothetical protein